MKKNDWHNSSHIISWVFTNKPQPSALIKYLFIQSFFSWTRVSVTRFLYNLNSFLKLSHWGTQSSKLPIDEFPNLFKYVNYTTITSSLWLNSTRGMASIWSTDQNLHFLSRVYKVKSELNVHFYYKFHNSRPIY